MNQFLSEKIFIMTLKKRNALCLVFIMAFCFFVKAQKFEQTGYASYYHSAFQGRYTSCGEIFDNAKYTAAHATLPFQTLVKVTNLSNQKYVIVKINDRCPKYYNRIIDLSQAAAKKIDIILSGIANVKMEVITESELNYVSPCSDSIFQNDTSGNISIKCNITGMILFRSVLEQFFFSSIFSVNLEAVRSRNYYYENRKRTLKNNVHILCTRDFRD